MRGLAKALALFSGASVASTIIQLIKGKIGAVVLGTSGVGVMSQLTYLWNLCHTITGLGFFNGLVRRISSCQHQNDFDAIRRQLTSTVLLLTAFSLAVSALGAVHSQAISNVLLNDGGGHADLVAIILLSLPIAVNARIYRGVLSGMRAVKSIVRAQIAADLVGLLLFVVLVLSWNLKGAVIAFAGLHLVKLVLYFRALSVVMPSDFAKISTRQFSSSEIRHNLGFGVSGLLLVSVGILSTLTVSRWIISEFGLAENGVFSVSWKVVTVYLGALYASASGYYFPLLSSSKTNRELTAHINDALALYMYLIPPAAALLMLGGEFMIRVLFSIEFVKAASLLLLLLPGDMFRISAETIGLALLAKRNLVLYTSAYLIWASSFLLLTWWLLPIHGLMGVAFSYLVSHVLNLVVILLWTRKAFTFRFRDQSLFALVRGLSLLALVALLCFRSENYALELIVGSLVLVGWLLFSLLDSSFRDLFQSGVRAIVRNV